MGREKLFSKIEDNNFRRFFPQKIEQMDYYDGDGEIWT